jgi:hypothetical protein
MITVTIMVIIIAFNLGCYAAYGDVSKPWATQHTWRKWEILSKFWSEKVNASHVISLPRYRWKDNVGPLKHSGYYTYRPVWHSTFYVLPTHCFMCFVWITKQTAIISLYSINLLVFITETEYVYCAVRTEPLPLTPIGHYIYQQCNIQQFYVLPTQCIYVFCVDLRTDSDYFPIQH